MKRIITKIAFILAFGAAFISSTEAQSSHYASVDIPCIQGEFQVVVQSRESLDSLMHLLRYNVIEDCLEKFPIPPIDFTNYTLIGIGVVESGCDFPTIDTQILTASNSMLIKAKVVIDGLCKEVMSSSQWYLVNKIPEDTEVVFKIESVVSSQ
jgi:hypothetical protein